MAEKKERNVLPPHLANHSFAKKYKYIDYDEVLGEFAPHQYPLIKG